MDLRLYVRSVQEQLAAASAVGDEGTRRAGQLLSTALEPAIRLALQDALSDVAAEASAEMAPGRLDLGLRGGEVDITVVPGDAVPAEGPSPSPGEPDPAEPTGEDAADAGPAARVAFRPPQRLKERLESAAAADGVSLNAYLVRALTAHLDGDPAGSARQAPARSSGRVRGWYL